MVTWGWGQGGAGWARGGPVAWEEGDVAGVYKFTDSMESGEELN